MMLCGMNLWVAWEAWTAPFGSGLGWAQDSDGNVKASIDDLLKLSEGG